MPFKDTLTAYAKGDNLNFFWRLFRLQQSARNPFVHKLLLFLCYRCAHRHGGYIGADAENTPSAPEVAERAGSITNELLCRLSARLPCVEKDR